MACIATLRNGRSLPFGGDLDVDVYNCLCLLGKIVYATDAMGWALYGPAF